MLERPTIVELIECLAVSQGDIEQAVGLSHEVHGSYRDSRSSSGQGASKFLSMMSTLNLITKVRD